MPPYTASAGFQLIPNVQGTGTIWLNTDIVYGLPALSNAFKVETAPELSRKTQYELPNESNPSGLPLSNIGIIVFVSD